MAALEKTCFPADPWSEALFQEALENPRVSVLLAQGEDGAVLGQRLAPGVGGEAGFFQRRHSGQVIFCHRYDLNFHSALR